MAYLELTIDTAPGMAEKTAAALTAGGFRDLIIEDQGEFEAFLEENRACWDYIDEELQEKLQGLSSIKLYLEDTDKAGLQRLESLLDKLRGGELGELKLTTKVLAEENWEESWKDNYPPQPIGETLIVLPYWRSEETEGRLPVILDMIILMVQLKQH